MKIRAISYVCFLACFFAGVDCLAITKISVPKFVRNGTEEHLILDCEYNYTEELDYNLVVKWFLDEDPYPLLQWITELDTISVSDKFGDRINRSYEITSGNRFTKRRALHILRPTTEISGEYKCAISSHDDEKDKSANMTVYAHPTDFFVNITVEEDTVKVVCIIKNIFPMPTIEMFQIGHGEQDPTPVKDFHILHSQDDDDDAYDIVCSTTRTIEEIAKDSLRYFGCVVSLEGTGYTETKKVPYVAVPKAEMVGDNVGSTAVHSTLIYICAVLLIQFVLLKC